MVTEEEWQGEVAKGRRLRYLTAVAGVVFCSCLAIPSMFVGNAVTSGFAAILLSTGMFIGLSIPIIFVLVIFADRQQAQSDEKVRMLTAELTDALGAAATEADVRDIQVQRQEFESRLANALDMAGGEPEVIDVIQRSFSAVLPRGAVELLLADNSHAHLMRMTGVAPEGEQMPSCMVDSPDQCPAARRAQIQVFSDSDDLDACPKLRNRPQGQLSALCVPVSVMGRAVGVIHATGKPEDDVEENQIQDLSTLAKLAGARIGLLRVMAETQLQASTDTLTGLLNRRSFSELVGQVPAAPAPDGHRHGRPGPLQGVERHLRPRHGRPCAPALRPGAARHAAHERPRLSLRRRGVRHCLPGLRRLRRHARHRIDAGPARCGAHRRRTAQVHRQLRRDRQGAGRAARVGAAAVRRRAHVRQARRPRQGRAPRRRHRPGQRRPHRQRSRG